MEIVILLGLTLLNGLFSLSELALVSSKRAKLESKLQQGSKGARIALGLLDNPEHFLSAVQVGITLIGIVSGAYGGMALSNKIQPLFDSIPALAAYSANISFALTVVVITYLSIVLGELVPKSIAMAYPEQIAVFVAPLISLFTKMVYPLVAFLSFSTRLLLKLFRIKENREQAISEEEIKMMLKLANQQGVLENNETELHQNLFRFSDRKAEQIMTHRNDLVWLDMGMTREEIQDIIRENGYSKYLVCEENIDNVLGMVSLADYVEQAEKPDFNLRALVKPPVLVPEKLTALKILELFRKDKNYFGLVVDEFGSTSGVITLHDLVESILGDLPDMDDQEEPAWVRREDGSLLVDGSMLLDEFHQLVPIRELLEEDLDYTTLAGFVIDKLAKIPVTGDVITIEEYRFEIIDMDDRRVDKLLVVHLGQAARPAAES
jgi:putative hemolysin